MPPRVVSRWQVQHPGQPHPVAPVGHHELPGDPGELRVRVGPAGERPRRGLPPGPAQPDHAQVRRLGRALMPDDGLVGAAAGEAEHGLARPRVAEEEPGRLSGLQVAAVEEGTFPVRRRPVPAQVDRAAVLPHGAGAIGVQRHEGGAGIAVGVVLGAVEDDPVPLRGRQVAPPGRQPPAVPVVLGEQERAGRVQVQPADAAVRDLERQPGLAVERRGQAHDRVTGLRGRHRIAAVERLGPDQPGGCALVPADLPRAGGHAHPGHLVADAEVRDHPDQAARRRPDLGPAGEVGERHPVGEGPGEPAHQQVPAVW